MKKVYVTIIILGMLSPAVARNRGERISVLMRVAPDARSAAMGTSGTATDQTYAPLFWNPAGMADLVRRKITFAHGELLEGIQKEFLEYIHPVTPNHFIGGAFTGIDYGTFQRIEIDEYEEPVIGLGNFTGGDFSIKIGYAYKKNQDLSMGFALSFMEEDLDVHDDRTFTFDGGILYRLPLWNVRTGFAVTNVGPGLKMVSEIEPMPLTYRGGLSKLFFNDRVLFQADIEKPAGRGISVNFGGEYRYGGWAKLRAGWVGAIRRVTGGLGISYRGIEFDYAFIPYDAFGDMHRVSFAVSFGPTVQKPIPEKHKLHKAPGIEEKDLEEDEEPPPPSYLLE